MATDGRGSSSQLPGTRPARKSRSPPDCRPPQALERQGKTTLAHGADPAILAKGEKSQEELQAIFGRYLKAARLKAGLKQSEVAARTGLTQQYLSVIEAGQQNVTLRTMALLAEVVDHGLLDLLRKVLDPPIQK